MSSFSLQWVNMMFMNKSIIHLQCSCPPSLTIIINIKFVLSPIPRRKQMKATNGAQYSLQDWAGTHHFLQDYMCAKRRLRSACASAQSDQSLRFLSEDALDPCLPTERPAKTLIRLRGCAGWSESSLGAHVSLYAVSRLNFYIFTIGLRNMYL